MMQPPNNTTGREPALINRPLINGREPALSRKQPSFVSWFKAAGERMITGIDIGVLNRDRSAITIYVPDENQAGRYRAKASLPITPNFVETRLAIMQAVNAALGRLADAADQQMIEHAVEMMFEMPTLPEDADAR